MTAIYLRPMKSDWLKTYLIQHFYANRQSFKLYYLWKCHSKFILLKIWWNWKERDNILNTEDSISFSFLSYWDHVAIWIYTFLKFCSLLKLTANDDSLQLGKIKGFAWNSHQKDQRDIRGLTQNCRKPWKISIQPPRHGTWRIVQSFRW